MDNTADQATGLALLQRAAGIAASLVLAATIHFTHQNYSRLMRDADQDSIRS